MFRLAAILVLTSLVSAAAVNKTILDLMVEGRFTEARTLIADNSAGTRYAVMLEAMTEADAQEACALYRSVSETFPGTDCDSLAQERLLLALDAGVSISQEEEIYEPEMEFAENSPIQKETLPAETETVVVEQENTLETSTESAMTIKTEADIPPAAAEQRTMLSSVQKPNTPSIDKDLPVVAEEKNKEEAKASTGITVEYDDESKEKPEIQQAAATPKKSLVVAEEQQETADTPAEKLALLETKPGVKSVPLETAPHDLDIPPAKSGDWFVQVGAFGNHDNALKLAAKLRSAGYPVVLVPRETETGTLMQVRVGGYETKDGGKQIAVELKSDFNVPAVLVSK